MSTTFEKQLGCNVKIRIRILFLFQLPMYNTHIARVIDEPCRITTHRGIHNKVIVNAEHVAADSLALVVLLPLIGQRGPDQLARILNHHFTCNWIIISNPVLVTVSLSHHPLTRFNVPCAVQTTSMDVRPEYSHTQLGRLLQRTITHRHW